ncbi:MAG: hypothetical protein K6F99_05375 [Lachnospiraceae bacterium]|nr:hypothetical protein [Lachnospiraceae bacterium]
MANVVLKMSKSGISVILSQDESVSFDDIVRDTAEKFSENTKFFGESKLVISFRGRKLTEDQEKRLVDEIVEKSGVNIACILNNDENEEQLFVKSLKYFEDNDNKDDDFFKGTVEAGQTLSVSGSLIILGHVNKGATVKAGGNIVVLGRLYGTAVAGHKPSDDIKEDGLKLLEKLEDKEDHFIAAFDMAAVELTIDGVTENYVETTDKPGPRWFIKQKNIPKIAYVSEGAVVVNDLGEQSIKTLMGE